MQYIFDWEMRGSRKRAEIERIFDTLHSSWESRFGVGKDGYAFQKREAFCPLQAADILAWQMNNHMRKIWPHGENESNLHLCHPGFMTLRRDQEMDLGFFTDESLKEWQLRFEKSEDLRRKLGIEPGT